MEYGVPDNNETTAAIDDLQETFHCCGAEGFEDWRNSMWWNSEGRVSNKVSGHFLCILLQFIAEFH